jgi:putative transposase
MILAHVYKLKPNNSQSGKMNDWLNMLRSFYNFCLRDRIEAYEQARSPIMGNYSRLDNQGECCPLACSVSKSATVGYPWSNKHEKRSAGHQQSSYLPQLKTFRPWYKRIDANVQQMNLRRLNTAYAKFFDDAGNYPKFKTRSKFRSFSYVPGQVKLDAGKVKLPGIGWMRFYLSRPLPEGFKVRTVTIRRKNDGWYMSVRLENKDIPDIKPIDVSQVKTVIAADLGIKKLCSLSNGETIANPQYTFRLKRRKIIRQRRASRKIKGSKNRAKAYQKLAKIDYKITNQRLDYQWKVANKLCRLGDAIVFEDLNVKGMMARCKPKKCPETGRYLKNSQVQKNNLNCVIADAAWGELKLKTKAVAAKLGLIVTEVDPKFSSQQCSCCGHTDRANRDKERFLCTQCGYIEDADIQASYNLLKRGLKQLGISPSQLRAVRPKVTAKEKSLALVDEPSNPQQLTLFEWREDPVIGL